MVSTNNKTAKEKLEIINEALSVSKPYLKYFPGFKPIGEILNRSDDLGYMGYYEFVTDERVVDFPKGISSKTRCVDIEVFETTFVLDGKKNNGEGIRSEREIILSQEGRLIEWYHRFYVVLFRAPGKGRDGHRYVTVECKFSAVDNERLLELLKRYEGFFTGRILDELYELATAGSKERRERLQKMEQVETSLQKIRETIKT